MSLFSIKKKLSVEKQLGIQFTTQGIRTALVNLTGHGNALIEVAQHDAVEWNHQKKFLEEKVAQFELLNTKTNVLIPSSQYQIFLVEQPNVSANEKREAVRWRVAEYIDYPVQETVVDYIDVPQKNKDNNSALTYVVATKKSVIEEYAKQIKALGLHVSSIDIVQSALREIAFQLDEQDVGQALLHIEETKSHIILFKNKVLYMMRDFDLGYDHIKENIELQDLAMEIQRSIDYCASNLKNAGISRIVLTPLPECKTEILSSLSNILGLPVRMINYNEFMSETEQLTINQANSSAFAIGAAISKLP